MKKIVLLITTLFLAIGMMAQPPQDPRGGNRFRRQFSPEEYEKRMQDFITTRACLTEEEACKFFPLLKEMYTAMRSIDQKQREKFKFGKEPTEEECRKIMLETTELELEHKKLEQKYYTKKFPMVLSWRKIIKVRWALEQFKMEALRQFSPQRDGQRRHGKDFQQKR